MVSPQPVDSQQTAYHQPGKIRFRQQQRIIASL